MIQPTMIADDFPLTGELQGVFFAREESFFRALTVGAKKKKFPPDFVRFTVEHDIKMEG